MRYAFRLALQVGPLRFLRAMRSKNACKTCALGMGGQLGGMRNEAGRFPEVCKKSMQAMAADMRGKVDGKLFETYSIAQLQTLSSRELEVFGRLTAPVVAGPSDTHFRQISWEAALSHIGQKMQDTKPERTFFYASGRSSNEAGFVLNLFARAFGTNHVSNCSFYCHQASGVGLKDSIGSATATIDLDDLDKCDLIFLIGGNPASNHPRLMTALMKLRERGGKIIVINPVKEIGLVNFKVPSNVKSMLLGSEIATTYLQPSIGGDIAVLAGIAKVVLARGAADREYIDSATLGYDEVASYVESLSWTEIEAASGISRNDIEIAAAEYIASKRTVFAWTMGITHHLHGVQNVQWITNLALLRGMVGKPGAGLLPIRGHSNVQGMGTVGVSPALTRAAVEGLASLGLKAPVFEGYDTMAAMEASASGELGFGLCLGGNLYGANPDATFVSGALARVDTLVYLSTALNTGHVRGLGKTTVILPVLVRDEESQSTTQESMFSYVRLSDGGKPRYVGPRSEVDILTEIAARVLGCEGPLDWLKLRDHDEIRALISRLVPGMESAASIGETRKEFHIPGRIHHEAKFATPTRRATFHAHPLPQLEPLGDKQLRLMTVRSEGQFNTVVYDNEDVYRGQERRDVILMNILDIESFRLALDQLVDVSSEAGIMRGILVRAFNIARGCAVMYYPEANVLISRAVDPRSKTPAFKSVVVTVSPARGNVVTIEEMTAGAAPRRSLKAC
jgi:molybdopterin-dependent oxidoreductase alpha subunit